MGKQTLPPKFTSPASLKISILKLMELFKQSKWGGGGVEGNKKKLGQQEQENMLLLNYAVFSL